MDVMSPDVLWIEDRCYRLPFLDNKNGSPRDYETNVKVESAAPIFECSENNFEEEMDDYEEIREMEKLIETLPNNKFKLSLPISQTFWSKIIGAKGVTKKRIESDTNTTLIIPRPTEHGEVVIRGSSIKNLLLAKKNIEAIVVSSRQKLVFTHFISIPMNCDEIKRNFLTFKDQVLKSFGKDRGIDDSIFQNPDKLHLTVGTLVLTDQNERDLAEKLLRDVYEKSIQPLISNNKNILLEMKGIEYMNDDPAEVNVLYGKVTSGDNSDLIQKIADIVVQHFDHHRLLKAEEKHVKLHVTLMNTLFREEEPDELNLEAGSAGAQHKWNKKPRRTFNATNVLQSFHDFYFGRQELKNIQLSVRFSTAKCGYYKSSCIINL